MNIRICAPSYKRPGEVDTLKYLPHARIYVSNDEVEMYRKANPGADIVGVDPKYQGNLCRIRNHILDVEIPQNDATVIIDDDLQWIAYFEFNEHHKLRTEEEVMRFIEKYSDLARSWGILYWGIQINFDRQSYREYNPFSLTSYIGGPFGVHLGEHGVRYDEALPLKEDYDFTLQYLNRYRKMLRVNKYHYSTKQAVQPGGVAAYRSVEKEKEQLAALQRKWGSKIVKREKLDFSRSQVRNPKKVRPFDLNPILSVPIRGI